mmetsp:Transcript_66902/g.156834  ORF Transcript_66902/g.156834 Transcript_66902/m.156834 type:complete len:200 (-) Transcript_66902:883-1482(-)
MTSSPSCRSKNVSGQTQPLETAALAFKPSGSVSSCQAFETTEGTSLDVKGICTDRPPPAAATARPTALSYFAPMTPKETTRFPEVARSRASFIAALSLAVAMKSLKINTPTVSFTEEPEFWMCVRSSSRSVAPSGPRASSAARTVLPSALVFGPSGHNSSTSISKARTLTSTAGMASKRAAIRGVLTTKESAVEADVST